MPLHRLVLNTFCLLPALGVGAQGGHAIIVAIGEVNVLASGSRTPVTELTEWAQRGARRPGGDAIVDVSWE